LFSKEIDIISNILKNSGFPNSMIKHQLFNFLKILNKNNVVFEANKKNIYFGVEYNGVETDTFYRKIRSSFNRNIPFCLNLKIYSKKGIILREILNTKCSAKINLNRPGVYSIPCKDCESVYIGQTGRTINTRIKEHSKSILPNSKICSAVKDHVHQLDHNIDFKNTKVLMYSNTLSERLIVESYFIKRSNVFTGNKSSTELLIF